MVELIIQESGFPLNRPNFTSLQQYPQTLIDNLLRFLPGTRIVEGFEVTDNGNGTMTTTAGVLAHNGKLWSIEAATDVSTETKVSFQEVTTQAQFNVGTEQNPIYEQRDEKITRTAHLGDAYADPVPIDNMYKARTIVESQRSGATFIGPVVNIGNTRLITVEFEELPTDDYFVLAKFKNADGSQFSQTFSWNVIATTTTSFTIRVENVASNTGNLILNWTLINKNFIQSLTVDV